MSAKFVNYVRLVRTRSTCPAQNHAGNDGRGSVSRTGSAFHPDVVAPVWKQRTQLQIVGTRQNGALFHGDLEQGVNSIS